MARNFNTGGADYLSNTDTTAAVTAYPATLACWFNSNNITGGYDLINVCPSASDVGYFRLIISGNIAGDPVRGLTNGSGGTHVAATSTAYSANTWHHACSLHISSTSTKVYLDGGSEGTDTAPTVTMPGGINRTNIARLNRSSPAGDFDGELAEAAIWDVELTLNEIGMLAAGISPAHVRPGSLKWYVPILGVSDPEPDFSGDGRSPDVFGSLPVANHPPVAPMFGFDHTDTRVGVAAAPGLAFQPHFNRRTPTYLRM